MNFKFTFQKNMEEYMKKNTVVLTNKDSDMDGIRAISVVELDDILINLSAKQWKKIQENILVILQNL